MKRTHTFLLTFIVLSSCTSENKNNGNEQTNLVNKKQIIESPIIRPKKEPHFKERSEIKKKIEKKYGEQWDFCACIKKTDSIDRAFKGKLTADQEDKLIDRWDAVDSKCKELTTFSNATPEERAIYQKKVAKCLRTKNK